MHSSSRGRFSTTVLTCFFGLAAAFALPNPAHAANHKPIGFIDFGNEDAIYGWACDSDNWGATITVGVFEGDVHLGDVVANVLREDGIRASCGGVHNAHGFEFAWPAAVRDGRQHLISVFALDNEGAPSKNALLRQAFTNLERVPVWIPDDAVSADLVIEDLAMVNSVLTVTVGNAGKRGALTVVGCSQANFSSEQTVTPKLFINTGERRVVQVHLAVGFNVPIRCDIRGENADGSPEPINCRDREPFCGNNTLIKTLRF